MKILLLGKGGQLGFELDRALPQLGSVEAFDRAGCDLVDPDVVRHLIRTIRPDVIVNAAAYTAVDKAESEPNLAFAINGVAPGVIGEEARDLNALVVHYSTDYVFDGTLNRPYLESDAVTPLSVYGQSKLAGENALIRTGARSLIFRTSWVVGTHGGNFAKTILRLARERASLNVVADQWGAPTSAALLADVTARILRGWSKPNADTFPNGLYHLVAAGETNWYEYACYVVQTAIGLGAPLKLAVESIKPIPAAEYPLPAPRPSNSRLDTQKIREAFKVELPNWKTAIDPILHELIKSS